MRSRNFSASNVTFRETCGNYRVNAAPSGRKRSTVYGSGRTRCTRSCRTSSAGSTRPPEVPDATTRKPRGSSERLLRGIGVEVSALGVARHYRPWIDGYVFDQCDAAIEGEVEALGLSTRVTDSIMVNPDAAARLAAATLELAESRA